MEGAGQDFRRQNRIDGKRRVVRKHDVICIPPGVEHGISNAGLTDLTFIAATAAADKPFQCGQLLETVGRCLMQGKQPKRDQGA